VASQHAVPSKVIPRINIDARIKASIVNAMPVPPRSSDAYRWGNFKITGTGSPALTRTTITATMNPGTDNETQGTIHPATSSPIAHDASSTARDSTAPTTG
jgi:hypothetical protein